MIAQGYYYVSGGALEPHCRVPSPHVLGNPKIIDSLKALLTTNSTHQPLLINVM